MSDKTYSLAVLPGDGIGPEVMAQAIKILDVTARKFGFSLNYQEADFGGIAYDRHGSPLPEVTRELCHSVDAILLGSVGGPKWDGLPPDKRPEFGGLIPLRKDLNLYANLRPVRLWPGLEECCPIRQEIIPNGFDMITVRELAGGIYYGQPKWFDEEKCKGVDTMVYERWEIERIARIGFEIARTRKKRIISIDKSNVLMSMRAWRQAVIEVAKEYPDVELTHMLFDNAAMQVLINPSQFDVILGSNIIGDTISDETAGLAGSLGLLPSTSIGDKVNLYEPAGGSAPDIAGKGIANPIAQILSAAMMLEHSFGEKAAADAIWNAIELALASGARTGDIARGGPKVSTIEMGDAIAENI